MLLRFLRTRSTSFIAVSLALEVASTAACFAMRPSMGGGEATLVAPRVEALGDAEVRSIDANDVAVPDGYRIEAVATGFTFPTGVAFDEDGAAWVVESGYAYGETFAPARLLRVGVDTVDVIATGDGHGWMGIDYVPPANGNGDGAFYVAEAGITRPGRILRIDKHGTIDVVVDNLPSLGDHHVNGPAVKDGWVYFGIGSATNAGIVGPDNFDFGWLARAKDFHDIPCADVSLRGVNVRSEDPLTDVEGDVAVTGAYVPFGLSTEHGQVIRGELPCTGAVLRAPLNDGGSEHARIELVAWGFRNPFGLAFAPDGRLFVTDNGADERGSRPIFGAADMLWEVPTAGGAGAEGAPWFGWPDYVDGRRAFDKRYAREGQPMPMQILADMPTPPAPKALLAVHSSSNGIAISKSARFGHVDHAFVAQFGDQAPVVGKTWAPVGFKVVRVDLTSGVVRDFAVNDSKHPGPASRRGLRGLERPVSVRFDDAGGALYVVDFGVMNMSDDGAEPIPRTGALWRISRTETVVASRSTR